MTSLTYLALFTMTLVSLTACGGGGGGGSDSVTSSEEQVNNAEVTAETITATPAPQQTAATRMQELNVSEDFNFDALTEQQISLSYSQFVHTRAYVSVYSDFTELSNGEYIPKDNSRLVSGPLMEGQFQGAILALPQQTYLVEVWQYQGQTPLQHLLTGDVLSHQE